ncbi:hypothetical protein GLOTRDRAFT_127330 [Gloeophyllum trabeum ATCC 11539]|uniref:F-box domain-containing protein n=1 Tax=Gloeophyllum trabeum (strain ATCC 11539 / FP-39264 / Madison 617) TaxID=670483 RepID=S7QAK1_GLOTA|nr:uncharacterized protein GLOTRDRAFT_127330 [Gloeophyllum trabeum ATCC 11539]EPQ56946.1 hypothetical protein GLOTRDRAFT_127330 [Gloeophyllum trabeum ATCC 11539]
MTSTSDPGCDNHITALAPELWTEIFEAAAYVPGALQSESYDPFGRVIPLPQDEEVAAVKQANSTAQSLTLVCRRWRELASPILYRIVVAEGTEGLQRLHRTLVSDFQTSDVGPSLRASVRRFICVLATPGDPQPPDLKLLAELINAMPALVIFNLWSDNKYSILLSSKDVLSATASRGETLRVLHWTPGCEDAADVGEWRQMLSSLPNLRILRHDWGPYLPEQISFPPLRLPHLTCSSWGDIQSAGRLTPEDELPALRTLEFRTHLPNVPSSICDNITSLLVPALEIDVRMHVKELLRKLPNLVHLVMWSPDWSFLPRALSLPMIQKLGLSAWRTERSSDREYEDLFETLFSISAPELRVVRLIGWKEWSTLPLVAPQTVSRFQELARSRTFRVEDTDGRLLSDLLGLK